jgi:hypothetical protein
MHTLAAVLLMALTMGAPRDFTTSPGRDTTPLAPFGGPAVAVVSTAVADLTGQSPTSLRDLLAANRDKLPQ